MLKEVKTKEARVVEKIIQTPTNPVRPPQDTIEIEARIATNPEIMKRIAQGDAEAVTEYFFIMGASEASISEPVRPE
jgi:hypothetical protein